MIEIIIGLPCSGKTHLCRGFESNGYKIYDDFLSSFYDGHLLSDVEKNTNICISDPRLCNFATFLRVVSHFSNKSLHLTLFENDPLSCAINLEERGGQIDKVLTSIFLLSTKYDTDNYINYDHVIVPVYKKVK